MENKIIKKKANVDERYCVACGRCEKECPFSAISIYKGIISKVDINKCVGCGKCAKACPANAIEIKPIEVSDSKNKINVKKKIKNKKHWSDYMWIVSTLYLVLGLFNILFAWLGLLCFLIPLLISIFGGGKKYCNKYCGRGQILNILGNKFKLSRNKPMPKFLKDKYFRVGFLIFFLAMFLNMLFITYLVFNNTNSLREVITLFWIFKLPWNFIDYSYVTPWVVQFAFGFYSMMLTSTLLGVITMIFCKPNSWCVYCPMGTMTQGISIIKNK